MSYPIKFDLSSETDTLNAIYDVAATEGEAIK